MQLIRDARTPEDVAQILELMRADLVAHPRAWENPTLERFLAAMSRHLEGFLAPEPDVVPAAGWSVIAQILYLATRYE